MKSTKRNFHLSDNQNGSAVAWKLYKNGVKAQEKSNFKEALGFYEAAIKEDARFRPALVALGFIASQAGEAKLALRFYKKSYAIKKDASICFNIGCESFKEKDYKNSVKYLKESLQQERRMLKAHLLLAYLYKKIKRYDKASIYFKNAIQIDPKNRMGILGYAMALSKQGQYQNSLYSIERYLTRVKEDTFAYELRARLYLSLGITEEAQQEYIILAKKSPSFTKFSNHLNEMRLNKNGKHKEIFDGLDLKIDSKISMRLKRMKQRPLLKQKNLQSKSIYQENGIEGRQDISEEFDNHLQDMVDLSLLHLFKGDTDNAMKYLFDAKQQKKSNQVN